MKDIVFIAPFKNLGDLAEQVVKIKEYNNIEIVVGGLSEGVIAAKKAVQNGASVIISRGGTYTMIKDVVDIPVVELSISSFDILRGFRDLFNYKGKIGAAGYKNIIHRCEIIGDLLDLDIVKIEIRDQKKPEKLLKPYVDEGIRIFVGDTVGTYAANRLNCKNYIIESGRESIIDAMREARRIFKGIQLEKQKAERFKTIMDFVHDGIISVDNEEKITIFNSTAERIFDISKEEAIGKRIEDVVKNTKLDEVLKTGCVQLGEIQNVNNCRIATNRVPFIVDNKINGVVATFQDITKLQELEQKIRIKLQKKGFTAKYNFKDIIYKSGKMKECIKKAEIYSHYDSPVLILGKSGVGKELFAQSIHNSSNRKDMPFVAINCAALPENLIESELFGYVEGAFTSAVKGGKAGVFELAHRGTIFLDEIGEMSLDVQTRLLRVIQEKQVMRIGDDKLIPVDVRIISATNKKLKDMVNVGKFREDLYYRINILSFLVPELNDRNEDIIELSKFFINKYSVKYNKKIEHISNEARDYLNSYYYKGNVRELQGMIERAVVLCNGNALRLDDVQLLEETESVDIKNKKDSGLNKMKFKNLRQVEDEYIKQVIDYCDGSVGKASRILKISRTTLWRKMNDDA